MKKIVFIIFCATIWDVKAQTNIYHPFPDSNAVWLYSKHDINNLTFIYKVILTNSDTIINSIIYRKVESPTAYLGGMRQDTALKIVYFIPGGDTIEQHLYDFDLQVGDTLPASYVGCYPNAFVSGIDSELVGATYRKRFLLGGAIWAPAAIVEGVGHASILHNFCMNDGYYYQLECFSINNSLVYSNGNPWVSCITTGIEELKNDENVTLFPNPFCEKLTIEFKNNDLAEISLFDVTSRKLLNQSFKSSISIDTESLAKGIYLYRVKNKNGVITNGKVVKE